MQKKKNEKSHKSLRGGAFVIMLLFAMFILISGKHVFSDFQKAESRYVPLTEVYNPDLIKTDLTQELGSEANPFVVLEVVPYRGFGELGYLAEDCEPVDTRLLAGDEINKGKWEFLSNSLQYQEEYYKIAEKDKESVEFKEKYKKMFGEDPTAEELEKWKQKENGEVIENGYFTRVEETKGSYKKNIGRTSVQAVKEGTGDKEANIIHFTASDGDTGKHYVNDYDYDLAGVGVKYAIEGTPAIVENGDYDLVQKESYQQNRDGESVVVFEYDEDKEANRDKPHYAYSVNSGSRGYYSQQTDGHYEYAGYGRRNSNLVFSLQDAGDYIVKSVNETDDYNSLMCYDLVTEDSYRLNKGNGKYNVIFKQDDAGDYVLKESQYTYENGVYGAILDSAIPYQPKENGNYRELVEVSYSYVGEGKGDYVWTEDENQPPEYILDHEIEIGEIVWIKNQPVIKIYYYRAGYKNTNILKKAILKAAGVKNPTEKELENYQVKVVTVTPAEMNASVANDTEDKLDLVEIADMTYVTSHTQNSAYVWLYENYSNLGKAEPIKYTDDIGTYNGNKLPDFYEHLIEEDTKKFDINDLNWETVAKLFTRIATGNRTPVIFDYNVFDMGASNKNWIKSVQNAYYQYTFSNKENYYEYSEKGNVNNVSKLFLMCNVLDPGMFHTMYMEPDQETKTALIEPREVEIPNSDYKITTGIFNTQPVGGEKEDTKLFWNIFTFLPRFSVGTSNTNEEGYNTEAEYWKALGYRSSSDWGMESTKGNVFVFNGREVFSNWSENGKKEPIFGNGSHNFDEVLDYTGKTNGESTVSEILEYIIQSKKDVIYKKNIKVLDLEPCTIQSDAFYKEKRLSFTKGITVGEKPETSIFTAKDIRKYLNNMYAGGVEIVRQSTAEFNGKIEELSDEYDLIYIGLNDLMFNRREYSVPIANGRTETRSLPRYNDDNLLGKIYLHVGDKYDMRGTDASLKSELWGDKGVNWVNKSKSVYDIRTTGNDITQLRKGHLESYMNAGYPILMEKDLYNTDSVATQIMVDDSSNIYKFAKENKGNENLISTMTSDLNEKILKKVCREKPKLLLDKTTPVRYVGNATAAGEIMGDVYLKKRELEFKYSIATTHDARLAKTYRAKIYIDTNSDGKFAESECIYKGKEIQIEGEQYSIKKKLSDEFVGAIPWKIELTNTQNSDVRISEIGYSAIKRKESEKRTIRILQINQSARKTNTNSVFVSTLNLRSNKAFDPYLNKLNDYKVEFYNIIVERFEKLNVIEGDPKEKEHIFDATNGVSKQETDILVKNYDMLIFGFADCYDTVSNENGALDNLKYFIDRGKSVLFTHDVTSYNNKGSSDFGYSFNKDFRGILAMDRFGVRNAEKESIDKATIPDAGGVRTYETTHGYTNLAISILAVNGRYDRLSQYATSSLSAENKETKRVTKLNDGQITQYPYLIPDTIDVATTHGQYYQLDMEDPGIVVWYCLANDGSKTAEWYQNSYNDASNNYFIYSKGNVTYSGVGHSQVGNQKDEVKLFVNTMIASYRNAIEAPSIELLEDASVKNSPSEYTVYVNNQYENTEGYALEDYQYILFSPTDNNFLAPDLYVKMQLFDENGIEKTDAEIKRQMKVYPKAEDPEHNPLAKEIDLSAQPLQNGDEYILRYPKKDLNATHKGKIMFTVKNGKEIEGYMMVNIVERSMFLLD